MQKYFTVLNVKWYLDSSCSKHMTRDKTLFSSFSSKKLDLVFYGDNNKRKIIGICRIGKFLNPKIRKVLLVYGLKYNLLSISQLCDQDNSVTFCSSGCRIIKSKSDQIMFTNSRSWNTYTLNLNKIPSKSICLLNNEDESWVWHGRITHIHMYHLNKLVHKDLVIRLPNLWFEKSRLCDSWQMEKQVMVSFEIKNGVSSNRLLQLLHMDLFVSSRTESFYGNLFILVVVDEYISYLDKRCVSCLTETWKNYP